MRRELVETDRATIAGPHPAVEEQSTLYEEGWTACRSAVRLLG